MSEFTSYNAENMPKNLLSYDGEFGKIFTIWLKNLFLSIITLGIYRAWAKTNMRKYTFGSFKINDTRLEYSGKGGELFKGFVIVTLLYFILALAVDFVIEIIYPEEAAAIAAMDDPNSVAGDIYAPEYSPELLSVTSDNYEFEVEKCLDNYGALKCESLYDEHLKIEEGYELANQHPIPSYTEWILVTAKAIFFVVTGLLFLYFATFSAFRYRMTRTRFKGIRGAVRGATTRGYVGLRLWRFFLNVISIGILVGRGDLISQKYIMQNSFIGKTQFKFEPNVKKLDKTNVVTGLLALPTLFVSRYWYRAAFLNEKYNSLSLGNIKFESKFSGGKLAWLRITNILIITFSLGLLSAVVLQRSLKFFVNHVHIKGNEADLQLMQGDADSNTIGEGLDDATDLGGFDVDFGMI